MLLLETINLLVHETITLRFAREFFWTSVDRMNISYDSLSGLLPYSDDDFFVGMYRPSMDTEARLRA